MDLLADRSAELVAEWLREHPGVEIISRDRGPEYIKVLPEKGFLRLLRYGDSIFIDGAPDAIQVADRWHLLKNLRDTLKRLLESKRACLRAAAEKSS